MSRGLGRCIRDEFLHRRKLEVDTRFAGVGHSGKTQYVARRITLTMYEVIIQRSRRISLPNTLMLRLRLFRVLPLCYTGKKP